MATVTATIEHVDAKQLLQVLTRYKRGDFIARVPVDRTGVAGKIYDTVNDIIEQNQKLAGELQRISLDCASARSPPKRSSGSLTRRDSDARERERPPTHARGGLLRRGGHTGGVRAAPASLS